MRYLYASIVMAKIKKETQTDNTKFWVRVWSDWNSYMLLSGDTKWYSHFGKQFLHFLYKHTVLLPHEPAIHVLFTPENRKYIYMKTVIQMFLAALFITVKN